MKDMKDIRPRQAFRERTSQEIMFKLRLDTKSANWCVCVCVWCVCVLFLVFKFKEEKNSWFFSLAYMFSTLIN